MTFAGLALLLAGIGMYGVSSTSVAQRSYEIGVRMALGARRSDVMAMIRREGLRVAFIGAGLGLAGALSSTFLLRSIIYDVKAWDPMSLSAAVVSLLVVASLACSIPAARATAVDPNRALRAEKPLFRGRAAPNGAKASARRRCESHHAQVGDDVAVVQVA